MNTAEARVAHEHAARTASSVGPILRAADAYAQAARLEEHAKVCQQDHPEHDGRKCGQDIGEPIWYCPNAPTQEVKT